MVRYETSVKAGSKSTPAMSALGQKRTYAVGQKFSCAASIVDQLVGAFEHCRWDGQTDLFGGLQVDNEFEFGGLLDRNITRLRFARPLLECLWSAGAPYDTRPPLSTR